MKPSLPLTLVLLLLAGACLPVAASAAPWTAADLRLLDPLDAPTPAAEILAVYSRVSGYDVELRIDLLDIALDPDYSLQVLLDSHPIDGTWDVVIDLPAGERIQVWPQGSAVVPRLSRDPWLDTVTLRFNRFHLAEPFAFQVRTVADPGGPPLDQTEIARSDDLAPTARAPLLLAFWDSFPAATPAQALRRWDGAHTGPTGERHGLVHILRAAERYRLPVTLLDLKTPASLAALDHSGATRTIQRMLADRLLLLPDVAYGQPEAVALETSRRAALGFGLPGSQSVYSPYGRVLPGYRLQFSPLAEPGQILRTGQTLLVPLPAPDRVEATEDGPSLEVRRLLVEAALSPQDDLVVLGGSLPASTWGDSDMAAPTFAWLAAHPWINVLQAEDLLALAPGGEPALEPVLPATLAGLPLYLTDGTLAGMDAATYQTLLAAQLSAAPENPVTDSAWLMYLGLTAPTGNAAIRGLRAQYLDLIPPLLAAGRWAQDPLAGCAEIETPLGKTYATLASERVYAVIDPRAAVLTYLFVLDEGGVPHQIVGPTAQFALGLSDPSDWRLERGPAADPSVIPGAFADLEFPAEEYTVSERCPALVLTSTSAQRSKTFRLVESGIEVDFLPTRPIHTRLALVLDPATFFFQPTRYTVQATPGEWSLHLGAGETLVIQTGGSIRADSFLDSPVPFRGPENPNRDYPPGHFLPFPISLVEIQGTGTLTVMLTFHGPGSPP